jgi:putative endonuclease
VKQYFVYIVECADGHYYVGVTPKPDARVVEHNLGLSRKSYTFTRRPVKLVYSEAFHRVDDAIFAEKRIKGWSRRKKQALIRGDWRTIRQLSRNSILRQAQDDSGA